SKGDRLAGAALCARERGTDSGAGARAVQLRVVPSPAHDLEAGIAQFVLTPLLRPEFLRPLVLEPAVDLADDAAKPPQEVDSVLRYVGVDGDPRLGLGHLQAVVPEHHPGNRLGWLFRLGLGETDRPLR